LKGPLISGPFLWPVFFCIISTGKPVKANVMTHAVKNIHVSINKPADVVYRFASQPENFSKWVKLFQSMSKKGDDWIGKTDQGDLIVKWPQPNDYFVLDHQVILPNGDIVFNAMRIIPNNKGSEFVFTLFKRPGFTDADFEEDAGLVQADLETLKKLVEGK
jgi:hypothetical protein